MKYKIVEFEYRNVSPESTWKRQYRAYYKGWFFWHRIRDDSGEAFTWATMEDAEIEIHIDHLARTTYLVVKTHYVDKHA